jgi:hypothetical protein
MRDSSVFSAASIFGVGQSAMDEAGSRREARGESVRTNEPPRITPSRKVARAPGWQLSRYTVRFENAAGHPSSTPQPERPPPSGPPKQP